MSDISKIIKPSDIILFQPVKPGEKNFHTNVLRTYIRAIKCLHGEKIDFSYIPEKGSVIDSISIHDNLLMQSSQNIHSQNKDIDTYMQISQNEHLRKMLELIPNMRWSPAFLNEEGKKIVSIINAVIKKSPHIIVEAPETHLMPETLQLLKEALLFEALNNKRTVILTNLKSDMWDKYINKIMRPTQQNSFELVDAHTGLEKKKHLELVEPIEPVEHIKSKKIEKAA